MQALQPDPETGFLQTQGLRAFTAEKKQQLIQAIEKTASEGKWPGIHKLCKSLGISATRFYEHLDVDPEFKSAYDEALLALEDHCVENLVRQGDSANGVTANIFLLKNRWAKRWNENYQVSVDSGALKGFIHVNKGFIDVEATPVDPQPAITSTPPPDVKS